MMEDKRNVILKKDIQDLNDFLLKIREERKRVQLQIQQLDEQEKNTLESIQIREEALT